ncbi:hypothetical protein JCM8547_008305 [Rhodosporidiobolus lusitaniae]
MVAATPLSLTTVPRDTPIESMLAILRRDGGISESAVPAFVRDWRKPDFLSQEEVAEFNAASKPYFDAHKPDFNAKQKLVEMGEKFHAQGTIHMRQLLGRMPKQTARVLMDPIHKTLAHELLKTNTFQMLGSTRVETESSYHLSVGSGFHVSPGVKDQILHKDEPVHSIPRDKSSLRTAMMGCLIAGTRSTRKNGATRVIPGSHLWDNDRAPKVEEAVYAEMELGSAMFWFGSCYHGASANTCEPGEPDSTRILYGFFACQDFYRAEENQQLACPIEVAKTLPLEVLQITGWAKGKGGAGFLDAEHPYQTLGFPIAAA